MKRGKEKKTPDVKQIALEIAGLEGIKPTVRRASFFGDNHHDAIDAQITVLLERLSVYDVDDRGDADEWADNVKSAGHDAANWLTGDFTDYPTLVDSWRELVVMK